MYENEKLMDRTACSKEGSSCVETCTWCTVRPSSLRPCLRPRTASTRWYMCLSGRCSQPWTKREPTTTSPSDARSACDSGSCSSNASGRQLVSRTPCSASVSRESMRSGSACMRQLNSTSPPSSSCFRTECWHQRGRPHTGSAVSSTSPLQKGLRRFGPSSSTPAKGVKPAASASSRQSARGHGSTRAMGPSSQGRVGPFSVRTYH
mmetsp:Transcript_63143/g.179523  ORF Transcript_63143/g.179523 Transcript_63143/m.179523 type:complete len:206 (-) Transcript_63143:41-658(-)